MGQIPLGKKFSEMSDGFRQQAYRYFYKILPLLSKEYRAVSQLGVETNLEAFEELIEEGGVRLIPDELFGYHIWLFNLITRKYEDITFLKEELQEVENEDC